MAAAIGIIAVLLWTFKPGFGSVIDDSSEPESHFETRNETQCYGELGCISTGGWFFKSRHVNLLPASRDSIATKFFLYTRENRNYHQVLISGNISSIVNSNFDVSVPTKVIVHGFFQNINLIWIKVMVKELLKNGPYNVIVVDWSNGAGLPYVTAVGNARLVGLEIAHLLNFLKDYAALDPKDCHLIGHSLGAHVSGYAGEKVKNLGRITGLDPAGWFFHNTHPKVHLDYTDALFVDVIHSNSDVNENKNEVFGMFQPMGHVDFYPNGGKEQPGCQTGLVNIIMKIGFTEGLQYYLACHHRRARKYFLESINSPCPFIAYECENYKAFKVGQCTNCGHNYSRCSRMGFHAKNKFHNRRTVSLYLDTGKKSPFCMFQYVTEIILEASPTFEESGKLVISVYDEQTQKYTDFPEKFLELHSGKTYHFLLSHGKRFQEIKNISFIWKVESVFYNPFSWSYFNTNKKIYIKKIEILQLSRQYRVSFCGMDEPIFPNVIYYYSSIECNEISSTSNPNYNNYQTTVSKKITELENISTKLIKEIGNDDNQKFKEKEKDIPPEYYDLSTGYDVTTEETTNGILDEYDITDYDTF